MSTESQIQSSATPPRFQAEIGKVIVGHTDMSSTLIAVRRWHVLLSVPGLGKTLLIRARRGARHAVQSHQFTPDLMPADILGTNLVMDTDAGKRAFEFQRGPIFAHLILADEINRATPKPSPPCSKHAGKTGHAGGNSQARRTVLRHGHAKPD